MTPRAPPRLLPIAALLLACVGPACADTSADALLGGAAAVPAPDADAPGEAREDDDAAADAENADASAPTVAADAAPEAGQPRPRVVGPAVMALAVEAKKRAPGIDLGIAVHDFTTDEYAGAGDEVPHVSASSPKAIWVAAALAKASIETVRPHAAAIFEASSNDAATEVLRIAGANYVNDFYALAGMKRSGFTQWFGGVAATNSSRLLGDDNYITARDGLAFLRGVVRGSLLVATKNAALKEWMTWSPRSGFGGWLGTLLPASVRRSMMHKAGWLPPPYEDRCVNEIGLIEAAPGRWYGIALLARYAGDYEAEQRFVEHASCVVYRAVAGLPSLDCK